jgi:hypothetical protein
MAPVDFGVEKRGGDIYTIILGVYVVSGLQVEKTHAVAK